MLMLEGGGTDHVVGIFSFFNETQYEYMLPHLEDEICTEKFKDLIVMFNPMYMVDFDTSSSVGERVARYRRDLSDILPTVSISEN